MKVLISVLNWNNSQATIKCLRSLSALNNIEGVRTETLVIDNGSNAGDWLDLSQEIDGLGVSAIRSEVNLGFAGGHNLALKRAIRDEVDYVWLVNNDAVVDSHSLLSMLAIMRDDDRCGAVSPLIVKAHAPSEFDFCGAWHDWENLKSVNCQSIEEARDREATSPSEMWLMGAALLLRVQALELVGLLNEDYFAYYEDNDISARLSKAGWRCRVAFDTRVAHGHAGFPHLR